MKEFFIEKFLPTDNTPVEVEMAETTIMEARASLVVEGNFTNGRFAALFPQKTNWSQITLARTKEDGFAFSLDLGNGFTGLSNDLIFKEPCASSKEQTILCLSIAGVSYVRDSNGLLSEPYPNQKDDIKKMFEHSDEDLRRAALSGVGSAFAAVRQCSDCNTPEKICRYFRQEGVPFAPLTNLREFHTNPWSKFSFPGWENIQPILDHSEFQKSNEFAFKGTAGEILLRVLRLDHEEGKLLLPLTTWFRNGSNQPMFFFTPGESVLPLFNLDRLADRGDKTVILTDSVEIAAKNQGQFSNTIWSAFYGDWRYTDWEPLKKAQVLLLVTNHSGRSLAESYGTAKALADYLTETVKLENLGYIQLQTDYAAGQTRAIPESYLEMNLDEFKAMAERAEEALKPRPEFWAEPVVKRTDAPGQTKDLLHVKQQPYRYLLRPFLVEGTTSLIHAAKGVGKSALGYSIAGALTSVHKAKLCPGTWWAARKKPCRVLYLDFENSAAVISQRLKTFCVPYWGRGDKGNKAGQANLVIRYGDQLPPSLNYALPENHPVVLKWLEEAEAQGHVDLMVIDTYSRFINSQESTKSVAGFTALCNQINQRGTAVLIIHHSGSDGEVRGFKEKRDILYSCVHLTREGGGPADDLSKARLKVAWENLREPDYNPTQVIKLTPDGWMPDGIGKEAIEAFRRQNFAEIVKQYARLKFTEADMKKMLNVSNGTFYKLKKAGRE